MVARALAMARRVGDPRGARLRAHLALVDRRRPREPVTSASRSRDELVAVGRDADLPYAECDGQQARFLALVELGDIEAADAAVAAAHAAARTTKVAVDRRTPGRGEGAARRVD